MYSEFTLKSEVSDGGGSSC